MRAQHQCTALLSVVTLLAACETNTAPDLPDSDQSAVSILTVAPSFATIEGQRLTRLTAVLSGSAVGTPQELVSWASSDTNVATVAPGGMVEGRKAGRVLITARLESARGFATILVVDQVAKKPSSPPQPPR